MKAIPVQCCRCRHKHMDAERRSSQIPGVSGIKVFDKVCPRCGCKSFYDIRPTVAWCWATGLIEVGETAPKDKADGGGAIVIARGGQSHLTGALHAVARQGQGASKGRLLVPGVPEAESQAAAIAALEGWLAWCAKGNGRRHRHGVTFVVPAHQEASNA